MFGYVKPLVAELKVAEYEKYRAVYCGVCREIGKCSGQLSRLGLSYDLVLLCAVRMVLEDMVPEFEPFRCPAHLHEKRLIMKPNGAAGFTAAVYALLAAAKNKDDIADEKGIRAVKPVLLKPICTHMEKCGTKKLSEEVLAEIEARLGELTRLEVNGSTSADETSDAFGEVLSYVFSLGLDGEKARIAETIGHTVGKFIYMCDACDDLKADVSRHRYNPLYGGWGELALENGSISPIFKESVGMSTRIMLEPLGEAAEKLPGGHIMTPIIKNIIYLGLPASLEGVLAKHDGSNKNKGK